MSLRSLGASALLHGLLVLLVVFGLPHVLKPEDILYQPQVISVDLKIAPVANAPTRTPTPPKKPAPQPPKPKPAPKVEPEPVKKPEPPKPEKPKPKPAPEKPKPKPAEEKPKEKPEPKKEPEPDEPTLEDILNSVEKSTPKDEPQEAKAEKGKTSVSDVPYDPSQPASQTVVDSIRNQLMECWNYQGGAKEQENLVAYIRVIFREDGSIVTTELKPADAIRYNTDSAFRALVDSAQRATRNPKCVPLKNLPRDQYTSWSKMELVFDPDEMW